MRRGWTALLVSCACGRIGFDRTGITSDGRMDTTSSICSPVGHDEDADGIDDACDGCPHLPDVPQIDSDGDGVDDLCDPNPTEARDHIAFFDPFVGPRAEWAFENAVSFAADSLVADTRPQYAAGTIAVVPTRDVFSLGGHIGAASTTSTHQLLIQAVDANLFYYCELYDDSALSLNFAYTPDGSTFTNISGVSAQGPLANGDVSLTMRHDPPNATCATTWPASSPMISGPIPSGISPTRVGFSAQGLVVTLDYFIQIHSD